MKTLRLTADQFATFVFPQVASATANNDGQGLNWAGGLGAWLGSNAAKTITMGTTQCFVTAATTATIAGIRLPHGTAPSSPVDGDMWTTTAGLFVRINGATVGPLS